MQEKEPILSHTQRLDANNNRSPDSGIEDRIFNIRGVQVIIDRDLAELYSVPTSRLNEQVRRNIRRFPASFRFQLTKEDIDYINDKGLDKIKEHAQDIVAKKTGSGGYTE